MNRGTCSTNGHFYQYTTSDDVRRCNSCHKVQIRIQGVWIDKPKEHVQRSKPVETSQASMFDMLA